MPQADAVILDTKQIYDIAGEAGGSDLVANGANVTLSLTKYPLDDTVPTWYVRYNLVDGTGLMVIIDARSGDVIQTTPL